MCFDLSKPGARPLEGSLRLLECDPVRRDLPSQSLEVGQLGSQTVAALFGDLLHTIKTIEPEDPFEDHVALAGGRLQEVGKAVLGEEHRTVEAFEIQAE